MKREPEDIAREIRLIEYQKAQDSAEHHNNLMWTLIATGIGFSITILYLVWTQSLDIFTKLIFLFIGSFVLFYFSFIIEVSNENKRMKYNICKEIEKEYKFIGQHLQTKKLPISNVLDGMKIFRSMKGLLWFFYVLLIINFSIVGFENFNLIFLIGFVLSLLAVLLSIIVEIIYITKSTPKYS